MQVVNLKAPGGLDRLELGEQPAPGEPGPGEIRVRLHASSLNFHDYLVVTGASPAEDGRIPMSDGAGVVEAVGEGVSEFAVGDAVVSTFFPEWLDGPARHGDFATVPGTASTATPASRWCVRRPASPVSRRAGPTPNRRP